MDKFLNPSPNKKRPIDEVTKPEEKVETSSKNLKVTSKFDQLETFLTSDSWQKAIGDEFKKEYFKSLKQKLVFEDSQKKVIYPPIDEIFNAFNSCPIEKIKVVILGQDPYHGPSQAHGLSFSVKKGVPPPPSLKNIYKELKTDFSGFKMPDHGFLQSWANKGVFLLNATLTVENGKPNSHEDFGWGKFTDKAITILGQRTDPIVFMLWGKFALKKQKLINEKVHKVIYAAHPSPLSASKGFLGSKCFSKCNQFLEEFGKEPIDWNVDN